MSNGKVTEVEQVQARFFTKQDKYSIPDFPFAVSVALTSVQLNNLINSLIKEKEAKNDPVEFTFIINGEILLTSIKDFIEEKQLSTESVIEIEYAEKYSPPEPYNNLNHEDWVSSLQAENEWVLTGSYDHSVQLWKTTGKHLLTIPGHSACVKSVSWINADSPPYSFVSGSHDQNLIIWEWDSSSNEALSSWICKGHTAGVECVATCPSKIRIASGSWDKTLKIWSIDESGDRYEVRELSSKKAKSENHMKTKVPILTLSGHNEAVFSLVWSDDHEVITCSWDHTIKVWDVEIGGVKSQVIGNKAFFSLDWSDLNRCVVTCAADRHIRLYDPRSKDGSIVKCTLSGSQGWVTCVKWSLTNEFLFISGGHDKITKLWDTRSSKVPLYQMFGHEDKILCCDWSNPSFIMSGGCDNSVKIFSYDQ